MSAEVTESVETRLATPTDAPQQEDVSSVRLFMTLAIAGILAGLLIVVVYQLTQPTIRAYKEMKLQEAVVEVLQNPTSYETRYLINGKLEKELPAGAKATDFKRVYFGYDASGKLKGVAMERGESGFQDVIHLIFGYDPATQKLTGMKVLESKETPGLGDKIMKDAAFVGQFFEKGPVGPIVGVKAGGHTGDPHEVDMITGATISSRAVIRIINNSLAEWTPLLKDAASAERADP